MKEQAIRGWLFKNAEEVRAAAVAFKDHYTIANGVSRNWASSLPSKLVRLRSCHLIAKSCLNNRIRQHCVLRATFLGLAFKLIGSAEQSWRRIRVPKKLAEMLGGIEFKNGVPVTYSTLAQQPLAA